MPPRNPQRVIALAPDAREAPKYYLIARKDGFTGNDMYVRFWRGKGVLDLQALHLERPDWVEHVAGEYVHVTGVTLAEYMEFFKVRRQYEVREITADEASTERARIVEEQRKEDAIQVAKQKARQKAKTLDQESRQQEFELQAEAQARQKLGLSADAPLPAKSAPGAKQGAEAAPPAASVDATPPADEKLPHEPGGAMVTAEPGTGDVSADGGDQAS